MINLLLRMFHRANCDCPPGCSTCSKTGKCICPEHSAPRSAWPREENPTEKFARFCDENEGAIECRIYED